MSAMKGPLGLDEDLLAACVSCGLCLPHCPTYLATEEESASPRGRITLMRAVESGEHAIDDDFTRFMSECVVCRNCETACPSGVQFGRLMEGTRETLAAEKRISPWWMKAGLRVLEHHRLLLAGSSALAVLQRVVPERILARFALPAKLPIRRTPLEPGVGADVADAWFFPGCVMDAWQRPVHAAALRVMAATGARVALPSHGSSCCGALHAHAGLEREARRLAEGLMAAFPGDAPIVVDSAGCGAQLKDIGHLVATPAAHAFAARVKDIHEWLVPRLSMIPLIDAPQRFPEPVAIQDPCHLRHAQRAHEPVRTVLERVADVRILDDEGRCCGAGGAYSIMQPELAGEIRLQKVGAIGRTEANVVASANPGCSLWLAGAGLDVRHPIEIVDEVLNARGSYAHR